LVSANPVNCRLDQNIANLFFLIVFIFLDRNKIIADDGLIEKFDYWHLHCYILPLVVDS